MPRKFPHEEKADRDEDEDEDELPEAGERDEESTNPVAAIFAIIDRYYEGLKREKEGMGVD